MKKNVKILIVEDEYNVAKSLERDLVDMGMEVVGNFRNLPKFNEGYPGLVFDLAIIDLQLDDKDGSNRAGWEIVDRIAKSGFFPVIIHSSHGRNEILKRIGDRRNITLVKKITGRSELMTAVVKGLVEVHGYNGLDGFNIAHLDKNENELRDLSPDFFSLKNKETGMKERIWVKDITFIDSSNGKGMCVYHTRGKNHASQTLNGFMKEFQHLDLMRIHQSYIVNRVKIEAASSDTVLVTYAGKPVKLPLSSSYKNDVDDYMNGIKGR